MTGYSRAQFGPAWSDVDGNGCDQLNDVRRRDLSSLHTKPGTHGCVAGSGRLVSPYTGAVIKFVRGVSPVPIQIDHVVAEGGAWQTGASGWTAEQRLRFANDPLDLLAVDSFSNESKGDGDAATWLPPRKAYRCSYIARQISVKARYRLWVTPAEHDAMARILASCPGQRLPSLAAVKIPAPAPVREASSPTSKPPEKSTPTLKPPEKAAPTHKPPEKSKTTHKASSGSPLVVHPGAFCSPEGAVGVTVRGTAMVCSVKAGADRPRWRHS